MKSDTKHQIIKLQADHMIGIKVRLSHWLRIHRLTAWLTTYLARFLSIGGYYLSLFPLRINMSFEGSLVVHSVGQGSALGSQFQSIFQDFGIGTEIDFSKFLNWDWHRFFKILGFGLGLGLQIQDKIPRNPKGRYRNFKYFNIYELFIIFFLLKFLIIMVESWYASW